MKSKAPQTEAHRLGIIERRVARGFAITRDVGWLISRVRKHLEARSEHGRHVRLLHLRLANSHRRNEKLRREVQSLLAERSRLAIRLGDLLHRVELLLD